MVAYEGTSREVFLRQVVSRTSGVTKSVKETILSEANEQRDKDFGSRHCSTFCFTSEHVDYVARYGGTCRDCADEAGVCPSSGLPCQNKREAIRYVLEAIQYGVRNGFVSSPANVERWQSAGRK